MNDFFKRALELSDKARLINEVPVGAVVVKDNVIIGEGYNKKESSSSVIDHAEIIAITHASKTIGDWRLNDCELYVTLEPCNMCKEVIKQSRIKKVSYIVPSNFYNEKQRKIEYKKIECNDKAISNYVDKLRKFFVSKR